MFIIGELINGMYAAVGNALRAKDRSAIERCARDQVAAGASALDINCGPASKDPVADMRWLVETVQGVTDATLCIDSSKPAVIEAGLQAAKNRAIINSTTADEAKLGALIPLALRYHAQLIGLTMNARGVPQTKDQRVELAATIVAACADQGLAAADLYLDPIVLPVNVAQAQIGEIIEAIREFRIIAEPSPRTIVGLSNISQGASNRPLINRTFAVMAAYSGLDAAILDPLDKELIDAIITAEVIVNRNIYCDSFLEAYRRR